MPAGDIARQPGSPQQAVHFGHESFPDHPVVVVAGNHEFYGREIEASIRTGKEYAGSTGHVHLLDYNTVVIGGMRFVGSTVWTDHPLFGHPEWSMARAARGLNDHHRIERRGPQGSVRFSPEDALDRYVDDRAYIEATLATPFDGPMVDRLQPEGLRPHAARGAGSRTSGSV